MNWHRASVSGPQFFQAFPAVLVQRIVVGDPLAEQQSANAVRVPNALLEQLRALARHPTAVLFARAWWYCHGADPRLAALPGHQRAQQRLAIDRIGLGAPGGVEARQSTPDRRRGSRRRWPRASDE